MVFGRALLVVCTTNFLTKKYEIILPPGTNPLLNDLKKYTKSLASAYLTNRRY